MKINPVKIKLISPSKFEILAGLTRNPSMRLIATELEHYSDADENFLGSILIDHADQDYSSIILARDEFGKFCCIDLKTSMESIEDARRWLCGALKWNSGSDVTVHPQGHNSQPTMDLFKPIVPAVRQHIYFQRLISHSSFRGARKAINEMMPHFVDVDGNFVQQFQSDGFDSRVWELYLFAMLKESGFELDRSYHAPDFVGHNLGYEMALEAVIVGRKPDKKPSVISSRPKLPSMSEIDNKLKNEMPIRFGSPLFTKLGKRYWELEHVKGKPFVIAIADFHDDSSMIVSFRQACTDQFFSPGVLFSPWYLIISDGIWGRVEDVTQPAGSWHYPAVPAVRILLHKHPVCNSRASIDQVGILLQMYSPGWQPGNQTGWRRIIHRCGSNS